MKRKFRIVVSALILLALLMGTGIAIAQAPHKKPQRQTTTQQTGAKQSSTNKIVVRNGEDFLKAIGKNKTIQIQGKLNLSNAIKSYVESGKIKQLPWPWQDQESLTSGIYAVGDSDWGWELLIYGIDNITIEGTSQSNSSLLTEYLCHYVLSFEKCSNLGLKNLTLGHYELGACGGGVISLSKCNKIKIQSCDLFGCGTEGISAEQTDYIDFTNSTIRDCSEGTMYLFNCSNCKFSKSKFIRNSKGDYDWESNFVVRDCMNITFDTCEIGMNNNKLFNCNCYITLRNTKISHDSSKLGTMEYIKKE